MIFSLLYFILTFTFWSSICSFKFALFRWVSVIILVSHLICVRTLCAYKLHSALFVVVVWEHIHLDAMQINMECMNRTWKFSINSRSISSNWYEYRSRKEWRPEILMMLERDGCVVIAIGLLLKRREHWKNAVEMIQSPSLLFIYGIKLLKSAMHTLFHNVLLPHGNWIVACVCVCACIRSFADKYRYVCRTFNSSSLNLLLLNYSE